MTGIAQNWEEGLRCGPCGQEIPLGAPVLYGRHPECYQADCKAVPDDPVAAAYAALEAGGRISMPKKHLLALAQAACAAPVRRPDKGQRGIRVYGRMAGWSAARVQQGLTLQEVCGLWLDALETGRTPPVSHEHLRMVAEAAAGAREGEAVV